MLLRPAGPPPGEPGRDAMKRFTEVTLKLGAMELPDRLLQDIRAYSALVELAGGAEGPSAPYLQKLT